MRKIVTHKLYCITDIIFVVSHTVHVVYELLCNLKFVDDLANPASRQIARSTILLKINAVRSTSHTFPAAVDNGSVSAANINCINAIVPILEHS